jgi:hypothetical protein
MCTDETTWGIISINGGRLGIRNEARVCVEMIRHHKALILALNCQSVLGAEI